MFKNATKSISVGVVLPDPLFPAPSTSSPMKTPENTGEEANDPEQVAEGHV